MTKITRVAQKLFAATTRLSSCHLAYGVCGHPSPENMYSMNSVTCNFMRRRHVSVLGTLWGEGVVDS